jgi:hypothetical protein
MRTQSIILAIFIVLLSPRASTQWIQTNGPYGGSIRSLAVSGANIFAGTGFYYGVYLSTNSGTSWTNVSSGLTNLDVWTLAVPGTNLFAGTSDGLFLSTNNGTNWTLASAGLTNKYVRTLIVSGTNLFAGTEGGVFRSTNNGTSWDSASAGLPFGSYGWIVPVYAFAVSDGNLFAGTGSSGVFLSTNNGTSWTLASAGLTNTEVRAFAVSGTNLFAGTTGGIFLSTNNGTSWTAVGTEESSYFNVNALVVSGTNLLAGTEGGVYRSVNNGASWDSASTGLPFDVYGYPVPVPALAVSGTFVFAGTYSNEIWRRPLSEMITGVEDNNKEMPIRFALEQNYPNPFNPSTTIRYGLPNKTAVQLSVFNTLGQSVSTLVNGDMEAGYHEIKCDASGLSSGIYFYRLKAGDFVETKRLLLIR